MVDNAAIERAKAMGKDSTDQNAHDEFKEELNLTGEFIPLKEENAKFTEYEVRGRVKTTVYFFDVPNALTEKTAKAGDDAAQMVFIPLRQLNELLKVGKLEKEVDGIKTEIRLVPHHEKILAKIFSDKVLAMEPELKILVEKELKKLSKKTTTQTIK